MALTTQILDLTHGKPAENVLVELYLLEKGSLHKELINVGHTNEDGRVDEPLLTEEKMEAGEYELLFYIRDYFNKLNLELKEPAFLNVVPIRFGVSDPSSNYHVPLLVSPWGYQVYRGS